MRRLLRRGVQVLVAVDPEAVLLVALGVGLDRALGVHHRLGRGGRSAWIPAPTAAIIAAPSTGASLTRVNEIGTFETSACSCIHRSLAAGPPDTTWCVG